MFKYSGRTENDPNTPPCLCFPRGACPWLRCCRVETLEEPNARHHLHAILAAIHRRRYLSVLPALQSDSSGLYSNSRPRGGTTDCHVNNTMGRLLSYEGARLGGYTLRTTRSKMCTNSYSLFFIPGLNPMAQQQDGPWRRERESEQRVSGQTKAMPPQTKSGMNCHPVRHQRILPRNA